MTTVTKNASPKKEDAKTSEAINKTANKIVEEVNEPTVSGPVSDVTNEVAPETKTHIATASVDPSKGKGATVSKPATKPVPVKPKTSPEGMVIWLESVFKEIDKLVVITKDVRKLFKGSNQDIVVAITKLTTARDLIGKGIVQNGGKVPAIEE